MFGSINGLVPKVVTRASGIFGCYQGCFETLRARIIYSFWLFISKSCQGAEFAIVIDASKVGIAEKILKEDYESSLRPCAYRARKLKDCDNKYSACNKEAAAMAKAVSRCL